MCNNNESGNYSYQPEEPCKGIVLGDSYRAYLDQINNANLYDHAEEALRIDNENEEDRAKVISDIKDIINSEILLKRRDMIHNYGCVMDYMKFINEIIESPDDYDVNSEDVEGLIKQVNDTMDSIENQSMELDSYICAKDFSNMMKYNIDNKKEIAESVKDSINKAVLDTRLSLDNDKEKFPPNMDFMVEVYHNPEGKAIIYLNNSEENGTGYEYEVISIEDIENRIMDFINNTYMNGTLPF